jgi:diguanylate cyclase (GGDEF)-like protein
MTPRDVHPDDPSDPAAADPTTDGDATVADAAGERSGVDLELLDRLRPYLAESIMVLDADWTVKANLAPPGGLIGRGLGLGVHTLEDMHPDDAITVMDLGLQAFATEPGWSGATVVRMHRGDDTWGRYEITATNRFDDPVIDGMVIRTREVPDDVAAVLPDIERTSAAEMLAELLPLGVLLLDPQGRVVFANHAASVLLDRTVVTLKREGWREALVDGDQPLLDQVLTTLTATPSRGRSTLTVRGPAPRTLECRFTSEGGATVTCVAVTLEDVTEAVAARKALEARADRDPLTGVRNRGALCDELDRRLAAGGTTCVAFVDLDGFKEINDTCGHGRGDDVLIEVAAGLGSDLGRGGTVGRFGGDEFVVLADEVDLEELGHAIRASVAAASRRTGLRVTASVGVVRAEPGDEADAVIRRADEAMYEEKARRRSAPTTGTSPSDQGSGSPAAVAVAVATSSAASGASRNPATTSASADAVNSSM